MSDNLDSIMRRVQKLLAIAQDGRKVDVNVRGVTGSAAAAMLN